LSYQVLKLKTRIIVYIENSFLLQKIFTLAHPSVKSPYNTRDVRKMFGCPRERFFEGDVIIFQGIVIIFQAIEKCAKTSWHRKTRTARHGLATLSDIDREGLVPFAATHSA
jgi:hypothetical protein